MLTAFWVQAPGVPLALNPAVLAAVLTFIPNVGPVLAALPAVLIGLSEGPIHGALDIAGLYIAVQGIESYLVTPHVQKASVSLPPSLQPSWCSSSRRSLRHHGPGNSPPRSPPSLFALGASSTSTTISTAKRRLIRRKLPGS